MIPASNPYNRLSAKPSKIPPSVQRNPGKADAHMEVVYISQVGKTGWKAMHNR